MSSKKRKMTLSTDDGDNGSPSPSKAKATKKPAAKKISHRSRLCSVAGCTKQVQQSGVCCKHGAKTTRAKCSADGCNNVAKRGGLCRRHGAFELETCCHGGCKRVVKSGKGKYCEIHDKSPHTTVVKAKATVIASASTSSSRGLYSPLSSSVASAKAKKVACKAPKSGAHEGCSTRANRGEGVFRTAHDAPTKIITPEASFDSPPQPDPSYASDVMNLQSFGTEVGGGSSNGQASKTIARACSVSSSETQGSTMEDHEFCTRAGCQGKAVFDGVCIDHGAMQRVYANNRPVGQDSSPCWSQGIQEDLIDPQQGGDNNMDFLCDYYEDMYQELT